MYAFIRAAVLACCFVVSGPVFAEDTMKLPKSKPVVSITLPEKWVMYSDDDEFDAQSPDQTLYVRFWVGNSAALEQRIAWGFEFLTKNRITVDTASLKQTSGSANGFPMTENEFDASDGLGQALVKLRIISVSEDKFVVMLVWCTPAAEKAWGNTLDTITNTLARLG